MDCSAEPEHAPHPPAEITSPRKAERPIPGTLIPGTRRFATPSAASAGVAAPPSRTCGASDSVLRQRSGRRASVSPLTTADTRAAMTAESTAVCDQQTAEAAMSPATAASGTLAGVRPAADTRPVSRSRLTCCLYPSNSTDRDLRPCRLSRSSTLFAGPGPPRGAAPAPGRSSPCPGHGPGDDRFHLVQRAQYLGQGLIPGSWVIPVCRPARPSSWRRPAGAPRPAPPLRRSLRSAPPRSTGFISLLARPRPVNGVDDCRHRINPEPPRGCVGQGGLTEVVLAVAIGPAASPLPVVARWPACWP